MDVISLKVDVSDEAEKNVRMAVFFTGKSRGKRIASWYGANSTVQGNKEIRKDFGDITPLFVRSE